MGLDILGIRIPFQLFPQGRHVHPKGCHVAFPAAAPDFVGEVGVGQHLAHILGQQTQQLIFRWCQFQCGFPQIGATRAVINGQAAVVKNSLPGFAFLCGKPAGLYDMKSMIGE